MGLAWQQGPLATGSVGRFLVAEPLPQRLLFAEPLRRRMRVMFDGEWIADSEIPRTVRVSRGSMMPSSNTRPDIGSASDSDSI